jgi:hypothetical protein
MSEEDLELLITLDDPEEAPEEDTFNHPPTEDTLEYWLGKPPDQRIGTVGQNKKKRVVS